jgi:RimJ/RimL family protein N-acetyltransferase
MADSTFERLTSNRLVLRRFRESDIATFVRYRADPAVARFQSWEHFGAADGRAFFAAINRQHPDTPGEWFQFAIELTATGAMIGDCALHALADGPRVVEIGFTLAPEFQGRGYATEAVACLLDYVFGPLAKGRAMAITDARNTASVAVLERLGFTRDTALRESIIFKGEPCDEYLYDLRQEDWRTHRQRPKAL